MRSVERSDAVVLDGTLCGGRIMGRGCLGQGDTIHFSSISSGTTERDVMFSNLQLSGTPISFIQLFPLNWSTR